MVWLSIELNSNPNLSNSLQLFNPFQKNYWIWSILRSFAKSNLNIVYDFIFWHYINSIPYFHQLIYYTPTQCLYYWNLNWDSCHRCHFIYLIVWLSSPHLLWKNFGLKNLIILYPHPEYLEVISVVLKCIPIDVSSQNSKN